MDPNKTKVLSTEVNTFKRRIKEAIQIKLTKPALNRDNGYELKFFIPHLWRQEAP